MAHATVKVTVTVARRGEGEKGRSVKIVKRIFSQFHFVLTVETVINLMKECVVHTHFT